jgi:hypothetical protein
VSFPMTLGGAEGLTCGSCEVQEARASKESMTPGEIMPPM